MDYYTNQPYLPAAVTRQRLTCGERQTALQWHSEPELIYITGGSALCCRNGGEQLLKTDTAALLNSGDVYLLRPDGEDDCTLLRVRFSLSYLRQTGGMSDGVSFDLEKDAQAYEAIRSLLAQIAQRQDEPYSSLLTIADINRILYIMLSACACPRGSAAAAQEQKRDFSYAKTAIAYMHEHFRNEITLDEISGVVSLSPSYFSKYFRNVTGVSFTEYLSDLRLESALRDVTENGATISAAARDAGFANARSFITRCKKVYGCTPSQYKKKTAASD